MPKPESESTERQHEIAQGLRDEHGTLIGGLDVLAYAEGHADWHAGNPPPPVTTTSYDLGRAKAARDAELKADVMHAIEERSAASRTRMPLADFVSRFTAEMVRRGGEAFDDGSSIRDYAAETAPSYHAEQYADNPSEGPEECARADMSYWGE